MIRYFTRAAALEHVRKTCKGVVSYKDWSGNIKTVSFQKFEKLFALMPQCSISCVYGDGFQFEPARDDAMWVISPPIQLGE